MSQKAKKGFAYAWVIVIAAMLLQAFVFGVASNIHPQFTAYVIAGEGFKLSTFSLMFTIGTFVSAIASPFIGKTYNKFPIKAIFSVGIIVSMGGIIYLSTADHYWQFYLGYALAQTGISAVTSLGAPILVNSWFGEHLRGRALGIAFAGGSIGNIVLQSLVVRILSNPAQGYKFAYFWFGVVALIFGLIVTIFFIKLPKNSSEIIGAEETGDAADKEIEVWGYSFGEVKSIGAYWIYCIGFIFVGFYVAGLAMNFATYLNALKVAPVTVGAVGSVFALASLIGNIAGGTLFDKIGLFKTMLVAGVLISLATLCLIFTPYLTPLAFGFAICKGCAVFSYMSGPSILAGRMFGNKDFASILAISNIFFAIGVSTGSPLYGLLVETFGYTATWVIVLGCVLIAFTCILSSVKKFAKLNKERFNK